jgi:hypothetical protein
VGTPRQGTAGGRIWGANSPGRRSWEEEGRKEGVKKEERKNRENRTFTRDEETKWAHAHK